VRRADEILEVASRLFYADVRLAGIAILDALNGVDHWMRGSGRIGVREVADTYAVLVCQMAGARRREGASL
jgi:hypothetical protein